MKNHNRLKDCIYTVVILVFFFGISLCIETLFSTYTPIPAIFSLAVFMVSLTTEGYLWGIIASLLSVLAVNFAFSFPYFAFDFTIMENLVSAFTMLVITFMASTLTTKLKIQERLNAESEVEKMRANLLRAVSHDLRTPLTTIYGSSSAMIENYDSFSKEQILKLASGMKEDSEWMISMVENLLSVTRIKAGMIQLRKTPVVLEELVDAVLFRFKKKYPAQHVEVEIPDEFISIPMDAMLIKQVLINMLENAVQHAKGMNRLRLRVFTLGNEVVFAVIDDGCGIPKEMMADIFSGYFENKDDVPVDNQKRSMGIGLSVCSSIVKAHGGEIGVSNNKDGGCSFRFSLKMEANESEQ